jgi:hypothetical protein
MDLRFMSTQFEACSRNSIALRSTSRASHKCRADNSITRFGGYRARVDSDKVIHDNEHDGHDAKAVGYP